MAVTNLWAVKGNLSAVVKYIENPEKTTARDMEQVMTYISDANKTEQMMYVTGINCEPEIAAKQFLQTKQLWNKEGGRMAYHGYQSFRAGELDAETAHKIGVELAERLWGDRFEVVVATHLNTGHYHNHFCLNSVSFVDGYKYHDTKEDIRRMRDTSDAICRRYGLSIENKPKIAQNKRRNYREWKDQQDGKPSLRGSVKAAIDAAIKCSYSLDRFADVMRDMGYEFIGKTESGKWLEYPKVRIPGSNKCVRLDSLGPGYEYIDIRRRLIENTVKDPDPFGDLEKIPTEEKIRHYTDRLERAGFRVVITYHGMQLSACTGRRKYREYSPELIEDIRKLDKHIKMQDFCRKYRLDTPEQVERLRTELKKKISSIAEERDECRRKQHYWERLDAPGYVNIWKQAAQEKTKQMRPLYQELRMCDEILKTAPMVRQNAIKLVQQRKMEEQRRQHRKELEKTQKTKKVRVRVR